MLANLPTVKPLRESYNYASLPLHVAAHAIEILDSLSKAKQVGKEHARPTVLTLDDHAKGRSFQDFVKDEIFDPLTMGAAYRQVDLKAPMQGHYQFSGLHGPGVAVGVPNGLEKAMSFASGGVWMNARDMVSSLFRSHRGSVPGKGRRLTLRPSGFALHRCCLASRQWPTNVSKIPMKDGWSGGMMV